MNSKQEQGRQLLKMAVANNEVGSLRNFARFSDLSHSTLSRIINGIIPLSTGNVVKLSEGWARINNSSLTRRKFLEVTGLGSLAIANWGAIETSNGDFASSEEYSLSNLPEGLYGNSTIRPELLKEEAIKLISKFDWESMNSALDLLEAAEDRFDNASTEKPLAAIYRVGIWCWLCDPLKAEQEIKKIYQKYCTEMDNMDPYTKGRLYDAEACLAYNTGNLLDARESLEKVIKLAEKFKSLKLEISRHYLGRTLYDLGVSSNSLELLLKAEEQFKRSMVYHKSCGPQIRQGLDYLRLAQIYRNQADSAKANQSLDMANEFVVGKEGSRLEESILLEKGINLNYSKKERNSLNTQQETIKQAITICIDLDYAQGIAEAQQKLGMILLDNWFESSGKIDVTAAIELLIASLSIYPCNWNHPFRKLVWDYLSAVKGCDLKQGSWQKTLEHLKQKAYNCEGDFKPLKKLDSRINLNIEDLFKKISSL